MKFDVNFLRILIPVCAPFKLLAGFCPDCRRTHPRTPISCRRAIDKLLKASSVINCAVFLSNARRLPGRMISLMLSLCSSSKCRNLKMVVSSGKRVMPASHPANWQYSGVSCRASSIAGSDRPNHCYRK